MSKTYKSPLSVESREQMYQTMRRSSPQTRGGPLWQGGICLHIPYHHSSYLPWWDLRAAIQYAMTTDWHCTLRFAPIYLPNAILGEHVEDAGVVGRSRVRDLWLKNWVKTGEAWTAATFPLDAREEVFGYYPGNRIPL